MNEFNLTISTPAGTIFKDKATQVSVRGTEGELAVLAGHIPFVTALVPAECRIYLPDGSKRNFKCGSGIINVSNANAAGAALASAGNPPDDESSASIEVIILSSEAAMDA